MAFDPDKHHRRSIRIRGYDYAQPGTYFVTIATQNRACLFGEIVDDAVRLNASGRMVEDWWQELARKFSHVTLDAYVVMPNHFHGVITIVGADLGVRPALQAPALTKAGQDINASPGAHTGAPLPEMVQWFKTMTTNAYIRGVKEDGWPTFEEQLWQRNYYEHVVRDEADLARIREYIEGNPAAWSADPENPGTVPSL